MWLTINRWLYGHVRRSGMFFNICSVASVGGKLLGKRLLLLLLTWKSAVNTHRCTLDNTSWLNFWLLKDNLQLKFITECRLFMVITMLMWVQCMHHWGKMYKEGEQRKVLQNKVDNLWQQPMSLTQERLMYWLRTIDKSLRGKLLSSLVLHRNVWFTLMFFSTKMFVQDGFLAYWW